MRTLAALGVLALACGATAAAQRDTLHDRVMGLYAFSPRTLGKAERQAKGKELDAFWNEIKSGGPGSLDALRRELARSDTPSFFNYDGAKLLLSLSKTTEDRSLALASIPRAKLRDIVWDDYFFTVHSLAVSELDTTAAAFTILAEDKFEVFVPTHSLTLDQEMCLLYLLMPTRESYYLDKAERRLFSEKSVVAQKSLLSLLAHTVTKSGDEAIARFATAPEQAAESREFAKTILDSTRQMESSFFWGFSFKSCGTLKADERTLFARVSDEALSEWDHLRVQVRRNCRA